MAITDIQNDPTYQRLMQNLLNLGNGLILNFVTLKTATQINLKPALNGPLPTIFYLDVLSAIERDFETKILNIALLPSDLRFPEKKDVLLVLHENTLEAKLERLRKKYKDLRSAESAASEPERRRGN